MVPLILWNYLHMQCWSLKLSGTHLESEACVLDPSYVQCRPESGSALSDATFVMFTWLLQ